MGRLGAFATGRDGSNLAFRAGPLLAETCRIALAHYLLAHAPIRRRRTR